MTITLALLATLAGGALPADACTPATGDAAALVARAVAAAGIPNDGRVLRYAYSDDVAQDYQSDRMYPPYLAIQWRGDFFLEPRARVQRLEPRFFGLGSESPRPMVTVHGERATYLARDTAMAPSVGAHAQALRTRALDAWTVLRDWQQAADARVVARCTYREWPRVVLARATPDGEERLYLDPKSGYPVKLDRREPHFLWGDVRVEYLWTNWHRVGASHMPIGAWRVVDGEPEVARTVGAMALAPRDSAPPLALPADAPAMPTRAPDWPAPDTVRVGPQAFLLVNRAYTNLVTLARDTVWVLDAQLNEARARQDADWIARLFPGRHPVALVVTDLAWPHIGGVRHWVARGATVYSHAESEPFLRRVVERRWTLAPDSLERLRRAAPARAALRFRAVRDSLRLGGGAVTLHAIDGLGSEGALMAWLRDDRFLWAGDYVQDTRAASTYAEEVVAAARRVGLAPERLAAMHIPITAWARVAALVDAPARVGDAR